MGASGHDRTYPSPGTARAARNLPIPARCGTLDGPDEPGTLCAWAGRKAFLALRFTGGTFDDNAGLVTSILSVVVGP